ncbi:MAG: NUDIX domain-containing protein [Bacteroidales bacterium]
MYKVYYDNRFILVSSQPDRLQKYSLFHKFHDQSDLYAQIGNFINNGSIESLNLYSYKIDHLWDSFKSYFRCLEAAGGLVKDNQNRLLFIHRFGKWDIPKGHIEKGESAPDCALREVKEESGIKADRIVHRLKDTHHIYPYNDSFCLKTTSWFYMTYSGDPSTRPQLSEGITRAEWIDEDNLATVISDTWLSLREVIQEVRSKFLK